MHPRNINCITAAGIDCCCIANNHVLDWGYDGLAETLRTLDAAGIAHTGAGRDAVEAAVPAVLDVPGKGRVLVFSYGSPTSGVPREWAATAHRPGVNFLEDTSEKTARRIAGEMRGFNRPCDVIVASGHWGGNWGYRIRDEETRFAHQLIEHGIAVVHGHSSHHVKTAQIHSDRLVLYGCGDFLNDYEGISGHEVFRSDLRLMYLPPRLIRDEASSLEARLVPMRVARFRLIATTPSHSPFPVMKRIESCGQDERSQRIRNTALTSLGCEVGLQFFFLLLSACKPLQQPIRVRASDKERLPREVDSWNTSLMDVADAISGEARRFLLRYWKLSKSDTSFTFKGWIWRKVGQSQQQNQCTGFSTGEWSRPPELFRTPKTSFCVLRAKVA